MIALDTNVLVRFLVEDDPAQSAAAAALVERSVVSGEPIYLSDLVLGELVWVLERSYRFGRKEIAACLLKLYRAAAVVFDSHERVGRAISLYERGSAGFADYLITQSAADAGATTLYSFDGRLVSESHAIEP